MVQQLVLALSDPSSEVLKVLLGSCFGAIVGPSVLLFVL